MNYFRFHRWVSWFSKYLIWDYPAEKGKVFLTFDDGPHPDITPWVLEVLRQKSIKATFFCVGANIEKYPKLFDQLKNEGHLIGNHTFNHEMGWEEQTRSYVASVDACEKLVGNKLFRPPYGRISLAQIRQLKRRYQIVMWSLLSRDYSVRKDPKKLLQSLTKKVRSGDVVVFHDSLKAQKNLRVMLPQFIDAVHSKGLQFELIKLKRQI